jgi:hypothetical protein
VFQSQGCRWPFLLVILTAAFTQFFIRGRLGFAARLCVGLIEVSGMIAVTLLFCDSGCCRQLTNGCKSTLTSLFP